MAGISTHVLDNLAGLPGAGMRIDFSVFEDGRWKRLKTLVTNADGRTDEPLLAGADLATGVYRLEFAIGDHFRRRGMKLAEPLFVDHVVLQVGIADAAAHYHVPLLASPWSYSTYRGS